MEKISQSPRDTKFLQNPFIFYSKLRKLGQLVEWSDLGMKVTCDFTLTNKILRARSFVREPPEGFFLNTPKHLRAFYENESNSMLELEPPIHTKLKSAAMADFTKKNLKKFLIRTIIFFKNYLYNFSMTCLPRAYFLVCRIGSKTSCITN